MTNHEAEHIHESEAELVTRAQAGDDSAFTELYLRTHVSLHSKILSKVRNLDLADDIMQTTYMKALDKLSGFTYTEGKSFKGWLIVIATNLANDHFRRHYTRYTEPTEDVTLMENTSPHIDTYDLGRPALADVMLLLTPKELDLVQSVYVDGMQQKDYAEATETTEGAVKEVSRRMRIRLRSETGGYNNFMSRY